MRQTSQVQSYGSAASVAFDMGDWDSAIIHFTPSNTANALIEDSTDGSTWIQVSTVATAAGVAQRIAVATPVANRVRLRVDAGTTGAVRVQLRRAG